ncbi:unnamed protein product [Phytomonas sp. EM1]|nr:unnamed protein product [Phytomonas sp. EM1]|eukprot:CCW64452.1 unnamed protein product [Phytomonas sp. isolate EM1]
MYRKDPGLSPSSYVDDGEEGDNTVNNENGDASPSSMSFRPPPLPDPPYGIPRSSEFEAERLGAFSKEWLQKALPEIERVVSNQGLLPQKDILWETAPHAALEALTRWRSYHDVLKIIMEHSFFFLFDSLPFSNDAPMPHVIYEDMMKALTFSSLQRPPMEHFALSSKTLRTLLCMAAHHCTLDKHYFTSASLLFRKMEQQQPIKAEVLSAWVYVCTAAGELEQALANSAQMAERELDFHPEVFAMMQNPSLSPATLHERAAGQHIAKGMLMRQRLCRRMSTNYNAATVALHAMFVYYALTLQHKTKWELLSRAVGDFGSSVLSRPNRLLFLPAPRTVRLALHIFAQEKGVLCGPRTAKALVYCLCNEWTASSAAEVAFVLLRVRQNEVSAAFGGLPTTAFSEKEADVIRTVVRRRAQTDGTFRLAATLIGHLATGPCWHMHPREPSSGLRRGGFSNLDIVGKTHDAPLYDDEKERVNKIDKRRATLRSILYQFQHIEHTVNGFKENNASERMGGSAADTTEKSNPSSNVGGLSASSWCTAETIPGAVGVVGDSKESCSMELPGVTRSDFSLAGQETVVLEFVQTLRKLDQLCKPKNTAKFGGNSIPPLPLVSEGDLIDNPDDYLFKTQNQEVYDSKKINKVLSHLDAHTSQRAWTENILKEEFEKERLRLHLPNAWIYFG